MNYLFCTRPLSVSDLLLRNHSRINNVSADDSDSYDMAPVQRGLYLSGQPLDHEPSLGQVPVASLVGAGGSPPSDAWLPPSHQFTRLRYGGPPMPQPPLDRQSPGSLAAVMQGMQGGVPLPPASGLVGAGGPPYPGEMSCDGVGDVLQYQQPGSTQSSTVAGRVEVF